MSVVFTDNFNRADENPLTGWTTQTNDHFKIVSSVATPTAFNTNDMVQVPTGVTFPNNQYAQVKVTVNANDAVGSGLGVVVRSDNQGADPNAGSNYRVTIQKSATNNVAIFKRVNGTGTQLAAFTTTWVDGDTLKFTVDGFNPATIRVYQNGVQVGTDTTDSSVKLGAAGIAYSTLAISGNLDDFEGGGEFTTGYLRPNRLRPRPFAPCLAR